MPHSKEYYKQYYITNCKKRKEYNYKWKKDNPELSKKTNMIAHWKFIGIIDTDLSTVYDYFITQTHCWICDMKYNKSYFRCLDHDHDEKVYNNIRYICCNDCNLRVVG